MKLIIGASLAILMIGAGLFLFWPSEVPTTTQIKDPAPAASSSDSSSTQTAELIIGDPNARATIIEYADYKCPNCGKFHQNVGKKLRSEYVDKGLLKIIFRPFPVYADGARALVGSYCAKDQLKFTEYHDAIFEYMWVNHFRDGDYQKAIDPVLTDTVMNDLMKGIGMSPEAYDACMASKKHDKAYNETIKLAAPDEIQGTPSFIINGQKVVGPQPYSVFKTLVDIQLR
jgi:protein-disulfide isomerase